MPKAVFNPEIKTVLDSMLLSHPMVTAGKMFGYPAYYTNKKMFACVYGDGVGIKVSEALANELIGRDGIIPFEPMGRSKMKGWILINHSVPSDYSNDLCTFEASIEFVADSRREDSR